MSDNHLILHPPEYVGRIPERTDIPITPNPKAGWFCHEERGTDVYEFPDGHLTMFQDLADLEQYLTDDRLLTTRDALKPGMKLLIQDLIGWNIGQVVLDGNEKPRVCSLNGGTLFMLDFVNDRLPAEDGTPALPRWICYGSANLAGIKRTVAGK